MIGLGIQLGQLLVNLRARAGPVGPFEAGAGGAALKLRGTFQRRKCEGDAS